MGNTKTLGEVCSA